MDRGLGAATTALPDDPGPVAAAGLATGDAFVARLEAATSPDVLLFAAVAVCSSLTALYLAIVFQIDSPYWAATTVLIVAQRQPGSVVGKGFYRAIGTTAGAVAATVLVALFAQMPELFILALSVWIALCTAAATLLRGFRSYGAVLAGYTTAIVALSAVQNPATVFDVAASRFAAILLGILCGAVFSALFLPGRARTALLAALRDTIGGAAALLLATTRGEDVREKRRALARDLGRVESLGEAAGAEDLRLGRRLAGLRAALAETLTALAATRSIGDHLGRMEPDRRTALLSDERTGWDAVRTRAETVAQAFGAAPGDPNRAAPVTSPAAAPHELDLAILRSRGRDAAEALERAAASYRYLAWQDDAPPPATPFVFHSDVALAARNGLRAFLAVCLAGAFWIASAWSAGGTFTINVCVACSLFATQPRPSAAAFGFMRGAALAIAAAFAVRFALLPWLNDFALLAAVLAPVMALGVVATTIPGWTGTATAFSVLFLSTVGPTNLMTYQPAQTVESGLATLAAFVVGGTIFRLVLPSDPEAAARRLAQALRRDLLALFEGRAVDRSAVLPSALYDRVGRIAASSSDPAKAADAVASLGIAIDLLRLRALPLQAAERRFVEDDLKAVARDEAGAAPDRLSERAAALLASREGADEARAATLLEAAASLGTIADALADHPGLLGAGGLPGSGGRA